MKQILICLLLLLASTVPAMGADLDQVPGMEELWEQAETYGVSEGEGLDQGLSHLFADALGQLGGLARRSLTTSCKLLAVVLLCGLAEGAGLQEKGNRLPVVEMAGVLAITALTMTDMATMIGLGRETIEKMDVFSGVLLPVMAVLTAASGGVTAAAARQGATVLFTKLLITAMDKLLIPLIYCYVTVSCGQAVVGNPGLKKLAALLKNSVTFLLTAFLLTFVGYLTASGAVAGSADASAVKAAKLAISRAIPVVGSILADASKAVLVGAGILRGTVGVAGMLVVLAICLTPFLQLALHYLMYKGTAALCATVARPSLSQLIDAIGGAFGIVLGMTGAGALVLLVSLVSALSMVTA